MKNQTLPGYTRTTPSGKASWEMLRDHSRRALARHERSLARLRRLVRLLLWGALGVGCLLVILGGLIGNAGLIASAAVVVLLVIPLAVFGLRPGVARYDLLHRPRLEADLCRAEGLDNPPPSPSRDGRYEDSNRLWKGWP